MDDNCPQCLGKTSRLVKEICGHYKCRDCLIKEEFECNECVKKIQPGMLSKNQCQAELPAAGTCKSGNKDLQKITCNTVIPLVGNESILPVNTSLPSNNTLDKSTEHYISKKSMEHIIKLRTEAKEYYKCLMCNKNFRSRSQRYYHIYCNETYKKPFSCEICCKRFSSAYHLKYHQEVHNDNQQYKCSTCNKIFSRRITFDKHIKNHGKNIKFSCTVCNAIFKDKYAFKSHTEKHKNIYPFSCQLCDKKFSLKSTFKQHQLVHSDKTLFECSECKKRFKRKSSYKVHISRHSKGKQHLCDICQKVFGDVKSLQRHHRNHDESTYYKCLYCSVKSKRKDNLSRHIRNMHPEANSTESIQKNICIDSTNNAEQNANTNEGNLNETNPSEINEAPKSIQASEYVKEREKIQKCSVIKSVGNVKSVLIPQDDYCNNIKDSSSTQAEEVSNSQDFSNKKRKKKYDPLEIYRKILLASNDDDSILEESMHKSEDSLNVVQDCQEEKTERLFEPSIQQNFAEIHWRKRTSQYFSSINT